MWLNQEELKEESGCDILNETTAAGNKIKIN
jgi:hypothetical protein